MSFPFFYRTFCFFLSRLFIVRFVRSLFRSLLKSLSILVFLVGSCRLWETPQARRLWLWNSRCTRYSIADLIQLNREHPRIPSIGFSFLLRHKHSCSRLRGISKYTLLVTGYRTATLAYWKYDLDAVAWYRLGLINYRGPHQDYFSLNATRSSLNFPEEARTR